MRWCATSSCSRAIPRLNLATFCTTWVEPEVRALMDEAIDKNIVDKDEYPQTAEIEARCVRMLADLWNAPAGANPMGTSTTGSSEAAMLAGLAAKYRWRAARGRRQAGRRTQPRVADRCRCAGRSSRATSTSSCARRR